jgi:hypothetical protein
MTTTTSRLGVAAFALMALGALGATVSWLAHQPTAGLLGIPFYDFGNTEGGHGAGVTNAQVAGEFALSYVYLLQQLGMSTEGQPSR